MKQDSIYFIDEQHKRNYKELLLRFPQGRNDLEYQPACYILAIPMILDKVARYLDTFKYPVDWIWRWEWKYTLSGVEGYRNNDQEKMKQVEVSYDLTDSMVQLGKLALNLWNGYRYFNLSTCISQMDEVHFSVVMCAIEMRTGKFMDWSKGEAMM